MNWLLDQTSSSSSPHFTLDASGRPLNPGLHLTPPAHLAPPEIKILALEWAKAWLGIVGEINSATALDDLDLALSGRRKHRSAEETQVLSVACRALYGWHHAARQERTKSTFPWLKLSTIEGRYSCPSASALNGKLIAYSDHVVLPLPCCDARDCACIYVQLTEGQRQRAASAETERITDG